MIRYLFALLCALGLGLSPVLAAPTTTSVLYPDPGYGGAPLLLGQEHSYTVTVRANKSATVMARIAFSNQADQPLKNLTFTSRVALNNITGYEQILPKPCLVYDSKDSSLNPPCTQFGSPDYSLPYYIDPFHPDQYIKLAISQNGNQITATLPTPLNPGNSSAIILIYSSQGYVTQQLGLYHYTFSSLAVDEPIETVRVAVQPDSDLYLDQANSSVNYKSSMSSVSDAVIGTPTTTSTALDRISSSIGIGGGIDKQGLNIAPGDYFTVKGSYAASLWRLQLWKILLGIIIVLAFVAILSWVFRRRGTTPHANHPVDHLLHNQSSVLTSFFSNTIFSGFVGAFLTALTLLILPWLNHSSGYGWYSFQSFIQLVPIVATLIPLAFTLAAAEYSNRKNALFSLLSLMGWLLVFLIAAGILVSTYYQQPLNSFLEKGSLPPAQPETSSSSAVTQ